MEKQKLVKHGQTYTKLYNSWRGMKEMCYNKNNKAREYWISTSCTGIHLADVFKVSFSMGCK